MSKEVDDLKRDTAETYIGDAVYVSFDGFAIVLRTGDSQNMRIVLEPVVLKGFEDYVARVKAAIASFDKTVADGREDKDTP